MTTLSFPRRSSNFLKRFAPLFGAGVLGVAALTAASANQIIANFNTIPQLAALPTVAKFAVAMAQPTILVGVFTAIGTALAPRLGLRSHIAEYAAEGTPFWSNIRAELPLAAALGAITSLATIAIDLTTRQLMPSMKPAVAQLLETVGHQSVPSVLGALLYGGITEELLMRYGLMTLFAWLGWKLVQKHGAPRPAIMWTAIALAALLFGAGHLPATSIAYDLTPFVIARALVLNGVFGLIAGWLYWRKSLEAAIAAHMTSHVVLTIFTLGATLFAK